MDKSVLITRVKTLISTGDIPKAIQELENGTDLSSTNRKNLDIIVARLNGIRQDNIRGILSYDSYTAEKNKIINSFFDLLNNIHSENQKSQRKISFTFSHFVSALLVILLIIIGTLLSIRIYYLKDSEMQIGKEDSLQYDGDQQNSKSMPQIVKPRPSSSGERTVTKELKDRSFTLDKQFHFLSSSLERALDLKFTNSEADIFIEFGFSGEIKSVGANDLYRYEGGTLMLIVKSQECSFSPQLPIERTHMAGNDREFVIKQINEQILGLVIDHESLIISSILRCLQKR